MCVRACESMCARVYERILPHSLDLLFPPNSKCDDNPGVVSPADANARSLNLLPPAYNDKSSSPSSSSSSSSSSLQCDTCSSFEILDPRLTQTKESKEKNERQKKRRRGMKKEGKAKQRKQTTRLAEERIVNYVLYH